MFSKIYVSFGRRSGKSILSEKINEINSHKGSIYNVISEEQRSIIKKIASEYPYNIDVVTGIYISNRFSEEKTIEELQMKLLYGDDYSMIDTITKSINRR